MAKRFHTSGLRGLGDPRGGHEGRTHVAAIRRRADAYDAVIAGGGPAGLSAALVLGRARRRVLVLDTERPANAMVDSVGGLLAQAGASPWDLRRSAREQLQEFPTVAIRGDAVVDATCTAAGFRVSLENGAPVSAPALVLAHGLRYDPPALPGIHELWGRSAFHCPFCDGWEVRDLPLAVHGNGSAAARSAIMLSGWSSDVVLVTDGPATLDGERAELDRLGVRVRGERVRRLVGHGGQLDRIEFESGEPESRAALFVRTRREQPNGLAEALGCELADGGTIETDVDGRTGVAGVYAAGDAATDHSRSVANAIGTGSRVAYALTLDLVASPIAA
jgi:thioredoxin reductase